MFITTGKVVSYASRGASYILIGLLLRVPHLQDRPAMYTV